MEGVKTFLESSTIHGLGYIPITRKYARLFWILTVLAGFSTAGYLIQQSFQSWAESQVKTTVETLPISEITFPKITVCPPRNTFTDLNYDLMAIENVTLDIEIENNTIEYVYDYLTGMTIPYGFKTKNDKLFEYASEVINDHLYLDDWMWLEEKNRFYNWYHGYTRISNIKNSEGRLTYMIDTSATSGVIFTKHFGEKFNTHWIKFGIRSDLDINIYPPTNVQKNSNVTLHIKLKRFGISRVSEAILDTITVKESYVGDGETLFKFKGVQRSIYRITSKLIIPSALIDLERIKLMPGKTILIDKPKSKSPTPVPIGPDLKFRELKVQTPDTNPCNIL